MNKPCLSNTMSRHGVLLPVPKRISATRREARQSTLTTCARPRALFDELRGAMERAPKQAGILSGLRLALVLQMSLLALLLAISYLHDDETDPGAPWMQENTHGSKAESTIHVVAESAHRHVDARPLPAESPPWRRLLARDDGASCSSCIGRGWRTLSR